MARSVWFNNFCNKVHGLKSVLLQIGFAVMNVLYKLVVNDGMDMKVLVAYRYIFAFVFIAPIAFFVERKKRPKLTWIVVLQGFLCGLFGGSLAQNVYLVSLKMTSATFATAMSNLIPPMTFVLAVFFRATFGGFAQGLRFLWTGPEHHISKGNTPCSRYENLKIRSIVGQAKVLGTLIGIGGAMLLTFYKGVEIPIPSTQVFHIHQSHKNVGGIKQVLGALLALASCLCYAIWMIIQAKMGERYPCYYSGTALMCGFAGIQSIVYSMSTEKDWSQWKLGWNVRLIAVLFSGIVASGLSITLMAWCVQLRGPLFVSVFNPFMLILVALAGSILLDEKLHLGSILGAVLIVIGLYAVLWGKGKEMKRLTQLVPSDSLKEEPNETVEVIIRSDSNNSRRSISCTDFPYPYAIPLEVESEITMVRCSTLNNNEQDLNNVEKREEIEEITKKTTNLN